MRPSRRSKEPVASNGAKEIKSEEEMKVEEGFQSLCRELNMDTNTTNKAWESYEAIKQNYTLEVR